MLDEPTLSRQWVARRLQRALSVERWCGPLREGLARSSFRPGQILRGHGISAANRAAMLESLIRETGSEPYGATGVGTKTARMGGRLVLLLGPRMARRIASLVAEHTLSEYQTLDAFVQGAPGVSDNLAAAIEPMLAEVVGELEELRASRANS